MPGLFLSPGCSCCYRPFVPAVDCRSPHFVGTSGVCDGVFEVTNGWFSSSSVGNNQTEVKFDGGTIGSPTTFFNAFTTHGDAQLRCEDTYTRDPSWSGFAAERTQGGQVRCYRDGGGFHPNDPQHQEKMAQCAGTITGNLICEFSGFSTNPSYPGCEDFVRDLNELVIVLYEYSRDPGLPFVRFAYNCWPYRFFCKDSSVIAWPANGLVTTLQGIVGDSACTRSNRAFVTAVITNYDTENLIYSATVQTDEYTVDWSPDPPFEPDLPTLHREYHRLVNWVKLNDPINPTGASLETTLEFFLGRLYDGTWYWGGPEDWTARWDQDFLEDGPPFPAPLFPYCDDVSHLNLQRPPDFITGTPGCDFTDVELSFSLV